MRSLWTKIGLGAFGIFALGMLLITLLRSARDSARDALLSFIGAQEASAATAPAATPSPAVEVAAQTHEIAGLGARLVSLHAGKAAAAHQMAFRLDGDRLGSIQRLTVRRIRRGDLPDVNLLVLLTDVGAAARLRSCDLVPADQSDVAGDEGFSCAAQGEAGLVTVGSARLEPLGISRPIRVSEKAATDMREGDPFDLNVDLDGKVRMTARGRDGKGVNLQADSDGASIKVDDALGRAIVRLLADSNGASLRIRGKDGRDVVRMKAGDGGFSLTVDTSAAN